MRPATLAHLSDLHIGKPGSERAAHALVKVLRERDVDHLVVTGDITHSGRHEELASFERLFSPFEGRMSLTPGNHDRLNDAPALHLTGGKRVRVERANGLHLVLVDSSGPHNRSPLTCHGLLTHEDLLDVVDAVNDADSDTLVAIALHHHIRPLPADSVAEGVMSSLGISNGDELMLGEELIARVTGRADLILHGHRHQASELLVFDDPTRPLALYNAGSSTQCLKARVFTHMAGLHVRAPHWMQAPLSRPRTPEPLRDIVRSLSAMFL